MMISDVAYQVVTNQYQKKLYKDVSQLTIDDTDKDG